MMLTRNEQRTLQEQHHLQSSSETQEELAIIDQMVMDHEEDGEDLDEHTDDDNEDLDEDNETIIQRKILS